jgi:SAM-dependent methyltransferase
MSTDQDWQVLGERDPYFSVLAHERFRRAQLTPAALEEFFRFGREELGELLRECRRHFGEFATGRTLDFGCGVGRVLIPLSEISQQCVGVDISEPMRAEAARNCAHFGRHNVRLVRDLEELGPAAGGFSFIHSYIVLQHIPPRRGLALIGGLLARLEAGGCAVLHVTFARRKHPDTFGAQPALRRLTRQMGEPWRRLKRRLRGAEPKMHMYPYDMSRVLFVAQQQGVRSGGFRFTDHAGIIGAILFLKRD